MVKLEIPPLQNTTTDVVIVANRLIKRAMNVLHDAVSVQSAKKWVIGLRVAVKTKICRPQRVRFPCWTFWERKNTVVLHASDLHIHAADKSMKETIIICKEQKGLLLAWYVCQELGIVPNYYPKPTRAITRSSVTKSPGKDATENETSGGRTRKRYDLLEEFKDVFDTNDQLKTMSGKPMQIHLNENVETFCNIHHSLHPFCMA